jgi:pyruvate/2-oxoglutarate/acetoin dehydrogenase E1 component
MATRAIAAADELATRGIEADVIDLRTLVPMDAATVLESVARTGNLIVVQEGPVSGGWAATLLARLIIAGADLSFRPVVLASNDAPVPYATGLEAAWLPSVARIVDAAAGMAEVA